MATDTAYGNKAHFQRTTIQRTAIGVESTARRVESTARGVESTARRKNSTTRGVESTARRVEHS